eukprot:7379763-Prymnesium_polylepis.1
MTATTVEQMFLYHTGLEGERLALRAPAMRSSNGGAQREVAKARADKMLVHHAGSKKQQRELCRLALVRASSAHDRKRYFQRGPLALMQLHWEERQQQQQFRQAAAVRKIRAQTQTSAVCPSGRARKGLPAPESFKYAAHLCPRRRLSLLSQALLA